MKNKMIPMTMAIQGLTFQTLFQSIMKKFLDFKGINSLYTF